MPQGQLAWITPVSGGRPDQGLPEVPPGTPTHPTELPPLPPGTPEHPIALPPLGLEPSNPIFIPSTPTHPIAPPPGTAWPPFNPGDGMQGKVVLLCWFPAQGSTSGSWSS
jgi:hypothetical protein